MNKGVNTIELLTKYGYAAFDTITVKKAVLPELNIDPTLSDPNATKEAQGLMNYLCDVYGKNIISGQQEMCIRDRFRYRHYKARHRSGVYG